MRGRDRVTGDGGVCVDGGFPGIGRVGRAGRKRDTADRFDGWVAVAVGRAGAAATKTQNSERRRRQREREREREKEKKENGGEGKRKQHENKTSLVPVMRTHWCGWMRFKKTSSSSSTGGIIADGT